MDGGKPVMTPFMINFYALRNAQTFEQSFSMIDAGETTLIEILQDLDEMKSIPHILGYPYKGPEQVGVLWLFKNIFSVVGSIVTKQRVSESEALTIENNVLQAVLQQYHSRNVEFGQKIDYWQLQRTILRADSRISTVALGIPEYQIQAITSSERGTTDESAVFVTNELNLNAIIKAQIVARTILSGRVQLLNVDNSFRYDFGQNIVNIFSEDLNGTTTTGVSTDLKLRPRLLPNRLQANENIILYRTAMSVSEQYSNNVRYTFFDSAYGTDSGNNPLPGAHEDIPAHTDYELTSTQSVLVEWRDENGLQRRTAINYPSIIRSTVALSVKPALVSGSVQDANYFSDISQSFTFAGILTAGQILEVKKPNELLLENQESIYLIGDRFDSGIIISSPSDFIILQEGEFLIKIDEFNRNIIIFGSGTYLTTKDTFSMGSFEEEKNVMSWVSANNAATLSSSNILKPIPEGQSLIIRELEIVTIGNGQQVNITSNPTSGSNGQLVALNNMGYGITLDTNFVPARYMWSKTPHPFPNAIEVQAATTQPSTQVFRNTPEGSTIWSANPWFITTRLDINTFEGSYQLVPMSDSTFFSTHEVKIKIKDTSGDLPDIPVSLGRRFGFTEPVSRLGGDNVLLPGLGAIVLSTIQANLLPRDRNNELIVTKDLTIANTDPTVSLPTIGTGRGVQFSFIGNGSAFDFTNQYELRNPFWVIPLRAIVNQGDFTVTIGTDTNGFYGSAYDVMTWTTGPGSNSPTVVLDPNWSNKTYYYCVVPNAIGTTNVPRDLIITANGVDEDAQLAVGLPKMVVGLNLDDINDHTFNDNHSSSNDSTTRDYTFKFRQTSTEGIPQDVIKIMKAWVRGEDYDWLYETTGSELVSKPTNSESFFNPNHIMNRLTIPQVRLTNGKINVKVAENSKRT